MDAQLVFRLTTRRSLAMPDCRFIGNQFGHHEQADATRAGAAIQRRPAHQMTDVLGHVAVAPVIKIFCPVMR